MAKKATSEIAQKKFKTNGSDSKQRNQRLPSHLGKDIRISKKLIHVSRNHSRIRNTWHNPQKCHHTKTSFQSWTLKHRRMHLQYGKHIQPLISHYDGIPAYSNPSSTYAAYECRYDPKR
ncbi:hypothetical protein A2U01_0007834 [Trifolium medium]|uniref:Uncharacterized protein n=1 Tax=Trifolium medium TaxID=97028 RepID=A0A392MHJ0_9FABA|nr:hypothetical protein [Trifolium medium]